MEILGWQCDSTTGHDSRGGRDREKGDRSRLEQKRDGGSSCQDKGVGIKKLLEEGREIATKKRADTLVCGHRGHGREIENGGELGGGDIR